MCISAATASLILGGLSAATSFVGGMQQANAQEAYNAQIQKNAEAARVREQNAISLRQVQEEQAAARKKNQVAAEAQKVKAQTLVSAAEANLSGNSIYNLVRDIYRQQGDNTDTISFNTDMTLSQLQAEKDATNTNFQNRLSQRQTVSRPSIIDLGLDLGSAYVDYKKAK